MQTNRANPFLVQTDDSGGAARCPICYETHSLESLTCATCNHGLASCKCYCDSRQACQHVERHTALNHDVQKVSQ